MKKALCTLIAVITAMGSSVVAFAKENNTVPNSEDTVSVDTVQPRLREKDIKKLVMTTDTEIMSNLNWDEENVTVIVKSVDSRVGTVKVILETDGGQRHMSGNLSTGETYTFYGIPSGGYTIYARANNRSGYCIFSFADDIF